jgi:uncharacterized protein YfaP (DUF2135 family)
MGHSLHLVPQRRIGITAMLVLLTACGGGDSPVDPNPPPPPPPSFPNPGAGEAAVAVSVGIPAGFFATPSQLTLFAGTQPTQLNADGSGRTNLPTGASGIVGVAAQGTNAPVLLGLNVAGASTQAVTVQSTAEALSMLTPALATSNPAQASAVLNALRTSPAVQQLATTLQTRLTADPQQALVAPDPAVMSALRTSVQNVLSTTRSPRYEEPARAVPAVETPTDRGGIQISVLPTRDGQGRQQVRIDNGRPRFVSVVRSYSNDGITWTTPAAENGTFGLMLGPGVQGGATTLQPPVATVPLTLSPYTRIKTFALGSNLAAAEADPDARYLLGAVALQGIAATALPAIEPVLATTALRSGLSWGTGDTGLLQQWALGVLPCFQEPAIRAAIEAGVVSGNLDEAFRLGFACLMRVSAQNPAILTGLLSAAGQGGRTVPPAISRMLEVIGTLGTGVEGVFNTEAIRVTNALNVFTIVDSTLLVVVDSVRPSFVDRVGGSTVRVFGRNLGAVNAVTIGGLAVTALQPVSATALDVVVPAQSAIGAQHLVVTTATGASATCTQCVVYFTPTIAIVPQVGPIAGGTVVTVTDLPSTALITAVKLGTASASSLTVLSPTSLRFTTPSVPAAGAVTVVFEYGPRGGLGCPDCFTYEATTPLLTGRFSGAVENAVGFTPLASASVLVRRTDTQVEYGPFLTNAQGLWQTDPLPAGRYNLLFSASGFRLSSLLDRELQGAIGVPVTTLPTVRMVPVGAASGTLTGTVRDATTNVEISGATVELREGGFNVTGPPLATLSSSATGAYAFPALTAGTYTVRATKAGFSEGAVTATVVQATQEAPVLFLSPIGTNVAWRFVLSWGNTPRDLDSHLTGPVPGSSSRFHVYFSAKGSATASPFARLDVDEQSGFGPETITMSQQFPGVYRYYVHQWSSDGAIPTSGARVDVYQGNTLVRQFFPPQGTGRYWTVFEIDGTVLTSVNTIGTAVPAMRVGPVLQVDSPASRAAAEWLSLMPWQWRK